MTPVIAHQNMLIRRLMRLSRILSYKQDGHGNDLDDTALRMVSLCLASTRADWAESVKVRL